MKRIIYVILIAGAVAASFTSCSKPADGEKVRGVATPESVAEPATIVNVEGTYVGSGTDPLGSSYTCEVDVTPFGAVFDVIWRVEGRTPYAGLGILSDYTFVVGYRDDREVYGVVAYTIQPDGSLEGISADQDSTKTGTETLREK